MLSRFATVGTLALALVAGSLAPASAAADDTVTYTGRVTADGKNPPRAVLVEWWEPGGDGHGAVKTAADGTYSIEVPTTASRWVLSANTGYDDPRTFAPAYVGADDEVAYAWQGVRLRPDAGEDSTIDIDLDARGSIAGTTEGATPKRATVYLERVTGEQIRREGTKTVAADGSFQFRYLVPGKYRVTLYPEAADRLLSTTSQVVTVQPGRQVSLPVVAATGGAVTGRLLGHGKPVAGAKVSLWPEGNGDHYDSATTDSQGRYRFTGVPAGKYRVQESGDDNGWSSGAGLLAVTDGKTTTRDLKLEREGALTVKAPSGLVVLADSKGARLRDLTDRTRITAPPGTYYVYVVGTRWARKSVTIRAGKATDAGTLRGDKAYVTVRGKVTGGDTGSDAKPRTVDLCDVACSVSGRRATVKSDGTYSVSGIVPGVVSVMAEQQGWEPSEVKASVGGSGATVDVRLTARKAGVRAQLRYQGVPVTGNIQLTQNGSSVLYRQLTGGTFDTGKAGLKPGKYRVTLHSNIGPFGTDVPYWHTMPSDLGVLTVTKGSVLDLGTVEVQLNR